MHTIANIYDGGWVESANTSWVGGVEYVHDDVSYFIASRKIELARFELLNPTIEQCRRKCQDLFAYLKPAGNRLSVIAQQVLQDRHLHNAYVRVVSMIHQLEDLIFMFACKTQANLNISLPSLAIPSAQSIDKHMYDPDILCDMINRFIEYINKLDVSSIVKTSSQRISMQEKIASTPPDVDAIMFPSEPRDGSSADYLEYIKRMIIAEEPIYEYLKELESYHCKLINKLNEVVVKCKTITDQL